MSSPRTTTRPTSQPPPSRCCSTAEPEEPEIPVTAFGAERGMSRLFINIGGKDGLRPSDVVGAIANEAQIPGKSIGVIEIKDTYSFVEIPGPPGREGRHRDSGLTHAQSRGAGRDRPSPRGRRRQPPGRGPPRRPFSRWPPSSNARRRPWGPTAPRGQPSTPGARSVIHQTITILNGFGQRLVIVSLGGASRQLPSRIPVLPVRQ